ncbi:MULTISPECIES: serine/threonine-protein kinase [unclassified Frankia]
MRGTAGFAAEARILASLDHPHVVRVYDYVKTGDLHLLVMEMLGGGTLTRRRADMDPQTACAVGLAVASALACTHGKGVLHRDIKPDNILFDTTDLLKVVDFGVAKFVGESGAIASAVIGTPPYMAPEQIMGGRLEPATDLYALGMVLYQLLAGVAPFDPDLPAHVLRQHHLERVPLLPAGVPAPLGAVVLWTLAKNPADRPPSAHVFACQLAEAAAGVYGPGWIARSGIPLRLDDDIRTAIGQPPASVQPAPRPSPTGASSAPSVPFMSSAFSGASVPSAGGTPPAKVADGNIAGRRRPASSHPRRGAPPRRHHRRRRGAAARCRRHRPDRHRSSRWARDRCPPARSSPDRPHRLGDLGSVLPGRTHPGQQR